MTRTAIIRQPAVVGRFYPADEHTLRRSVERFLLDVPVRSVSRPPKALIVPHAGYPYSGPVAASGYAQLRHVRETIRRVVLLGPSHHVAFRGLALSGMDAFSTPLGNLMVDPNAADLVQSLPQVSVADEPHRAEHSLEVQLPFLQCVLDHFVIVPFCVGTATGAEVAEVLLELWGGDETLIVVSSDLSHYHDYETAKTLDRETSTMIESCRWQDLSSNRACGCTGIRGLLQAIRKRGLSISAVDLRNSGDTAGTREQVVGYGAYVVA